MSVLGDLLFYQRNGTTLDDYLRHRATVELEAVVNRLPEATLSGKTAEEIVAMVVDDLAIAPLTIFVDQAENEVVEVPVEVVDIFSRQPVRVNGLRATKSIPFEGQPQLWAMQTNPYDMDPPRGNIRGMNLEIAIEVRAGDDATVSEHMRSTIARVGDYITRHTAQISAFNSALPPKVASAVSDRRSRMDAAKALKNKF